MEINYDKLFSYMFKNNISSTELSETAGISRNSIIKMKQNVPVHLSVIMAICEAYNLPLYDVLQEKNDISQEKKGTTRNE